MAEAVTGHEQTKCGASRSMLQCVWWCQLKLFTTSFGLAGVGRASAVSGGRQGTEPVHACVCSVKVCGRPVAHRQCGAHQAGHCGRGRGELCRKPTPVRHRPRRPGECLEGRVLPAVVRCIMQRWTKPTRQVPARFSCQAAAAPRVITSLRAPSSVHARAATQPRHRPAQQHDDRVPERAGQHGGLLLRGPAVRRAAAQCAGRRSGVPGPRKGQGALVDATHPCRCIVCMLFSTSLDMGLQGFGLLDVCTAVYGTHLGFHAKAAGRPLCFTLILNVCQASAFAIWPTRSASAACRT